MRYSCAPTSLMRPSWGAFSKPGNAADCAVRFGTMVKVGPTNALANLADSGTNALRDIKPPVDIPNPWLWLEAGIAALALALILFFAWRYWQKRRAEIPP